MREAVIVASSRTGLAKSFRGSFNMTRPDDLAAHCIRDVLRKTPALDPREVEDVILGCAQPHGSQGYNFARQAALLAGLPASTAAVTVNRFCASGLQAIADAAHQIVSEGAEAVIAGGAESISLVKPNVDPHPQLQRVYIAMGETAEVVAKRYGIGREAQDGYALLSQQRTARAQREGFFSREIAPMRVTTAEGQDTVCDRDECNRPDSTMEGLRALKAVFDASSGQGTVTAGNSCQLSDGASATLLMSRSRADALGIPHRLMFRGLAVAGCEPDEMGIGPVFAVPKLLGRHGLTPDEIDLWELNEAFAVQVIYCRDRLGIPIEKMNLNGGSISIGHPFGMTGSRMAGTLANQMSRMPRARYGVVTMCIGGGQGAAGLFEAAG
jgi:acetyl-CoA acyltransferase